MKRAGLALLLLLAACAPAPMTTTRPVRFDERCTVLSHDLQGLWANCPPYGTLFFYYRTRER